jgi:hypothetical protein
MLPFKANYFEDLVSDLSVIFSTAFATSFAILSPPLAVK